MNALYPKHARRLLEPAQFGRQRRAGFRERNAPVDEARGEAVEVVQLGPARLEPEVAEE